MSANFLDDLLIVDIPHADRMPVADRDISWKRPAFFCAEECDRQLLIGSTKDMDCIPSQVREAAVRPGEVKKSTQMIIATGEEAYRRLLHVATGMLDKHLGEKETIEQIRAKWRKFTEDETVEEQVRKDRMARFGNVMQSVFADSKAIRAKVFEDRVGGNYLRPVGTEPAITARNMLDIKPVDTVLIIGEKEGITQNTLKVIDTSFRRQDHGVHPTAGIVITHPDLQMVHSLQRDIDALQKEHKLKGRVQVMPYAEAMQTVFPRADFVINCQPMDNGKGDEEMIRHAAARTNPHAILVHLKGVPENRNRSSQLWQDADMEKVVFQESLARQKELDITHNDRMRILAERAIDNCRASRNAGSNPVKDRLLMEPEAYHTFISRKVDKRSLTERATESKQRRMEL